MDEAEGHQNAGGREEEVGGYEEMKEVVKDEEDGGIVRS